MAGKMEEAANRMEQEGFALVSCCVLPSCTGILLFRKAETPDA